MVRAVSIMVCILLIASAVVLSAEEEEHVAFIWDDETGAMNIKEVLWDYGNAKLVLVHGGGTKLDYNLEFRAVKFDPLENGLECIPAKMKVSGMYYIVQFIGPVSEKWYRALEENGVKVCFPVPNYGVVVKDVHGKLQEIHLPYIRAVIPYYPYLKCTPEVLDGQGTMDIAIFAYADEDLSPLISMLSTSAEYYLVHHYPPYWSLVHAKVLASKAREIANLDCVYAVSRHYMPVILNDVAAHIIRADLAHDMGLSGLPVNLTGRGQVAGVADTGLDTGRNDNTMHADFQGRIISITHYNSMSWFDPTTSDNDTVGHGTHVAGSVLGSGKLSADYGNAHGLSINYSGMAPEAKLVFQKIASDSGYLLGTGDLPQFLEDAYTQGARVHHNSWGSSQNLGAYDDMAVTVDTVMWNHKDYLISFSAGNSGPSANTIGSPATAKNCLSVGASKNDRPEFGGGSQGADDIDELAGFSSRGPTQDNRIKPDIVSPGTYILSTMSSVETWGIEWAEEPYPIMHNYNTNRPAYCFMGGTSMSGPITAGAALLVRQYFTDVRGIAPSAALVKATLINGAVDMGYGYPSNNQGWGRTHLKNSLFPEPPRITEYVDNTTGLTTGTEHTYTYSIVNSAVPLKVTLVWTDYPATANANPALRNNLDLEVIAPDGTTYFRGNQFENNWSKPNPTTVDARNNVENVFIKNPAQGTWTVKIKGTNVVQAPQPYALVVSAALPPREAYSVGLSTNEPLQKIAQPGGSAMLNLTVLNYGTNSDIIRLTCTQITGITPVFSNNNLNLGSGQSTGAALTLNVDAGVSDGVYEFAINATSLGNTSKKSTLNFKLVVLSADIPTPVPVGNENSPESEPDIAVVGNHVWVAYISKEGDYNNPSVYVKHSSDGGRTFTEKWKVSATSGYCEEPSITASADGYVLVAWHTDEKKIMANVYVPGTGWRGEKILRSNPNTYYPISGYASTLIDSNRRFWVFWRDNNLNSQTAVDFDIWASFSTDYGNTWSTAGALPNSLSGPREYMPRACLDRSGNIFLVFYVLDTSQPAPTRDIYYRRCLVSGTTYTWEPPAQLENASVAGLGNDVFPSVFCASDGKIWASWHSNRDGTYKVYLSYFDGNAWSPAIGGFGTATTSGIRPDIAENSNGVIAVAYAENVNPYGNANICCLLSSDGFATHTVKMLTADAYSKGHPAIDTDGSDFFVAYQSDTPFTRNDVLLVKFTAVSDLIPPTITHTPVSTAIANRDVVITATITDNNAVSAARLCYKRSSEQTYTEIAMSPQGNVYTATIPGTAVTLDGVDYYIEASDGINSAKTQVYHITVMLPALAVSIVVNNTVESGTTVELEVHVSSEGNAVENAMVALEASQGIIEPQFGNTGSDGVLHARFTAPQVTAEQTISINATANKTGYADGSATATVSVTLPALVLEIVSSDTVNGSETIDMLFRVTSHDAVVQGVQIEANADNNATIDPNTGVTDENGVFSAVFYAPNTLVNLSCTVHAYANATGYKGGSASKTIHVVGSKPEIKVSYNISKTVMLSMETIEIHINTSAAGSALGFADVGAQASAGSITPATAQTNTSGYIKLTYTAPDVQEQTQVYIYLNVSKTNYKTNSTVIPLTVVPLPLLVLEINMAHEVKAGENLTITVTATAEGKPVPGVLVEIEHPDTGKLDRDTAETDESGRTIFIYTAGDVKEETNITLTVSASKEGYRDCSTPITFTVYPGTNPPQSISMFDPYLLAGIIIGICIVIAVIVIIYMLRRPKQQVPVPAYPPQQYSGYQSQAQMYPQQGGTQYPPYPP